MQVQVIRNATLRMTYGTRLFLTDPYLGPKHSHHMETFDFDTVSRKDLRAMVEAEGIEAGQLLIPKAGEILVF